MADPALPPGFELESPRKRGTLSIVPKRDRIDPPPPPGFELEPTGEVVDGDTIRLTDKRNARLSGFDAWESGQLGYRPGRAPLRIGEQSTNALEGFITPQTNVRGIGKQTFGRPVVIARDGDLDAALPMLWQGHGLAAPEYLRDDPERRGEYLEAERLGRLNRQGAHATEYMTPDVHRTADRWNLKIRPDEEAVFTNDLPELRPEFQRLTDEEERDFYGFLASKSGDPNFSQADLDAYWRSKGRQASEAADPEFIADIRKGQKFGAIDYSSWDAATLADFKKQNAFAGMRPEVQEAYGAMLTSPDASPEQLAQFAEVNGMVFDPRDVSAFFDARKQGRPAPIPLPLINPGDGRTGAAARGFGDPLGFLDEMGAAVDAIGGTDYRENIFNSDRSFGDIYENNLRQNRGIIDYDETNHPYMRAGGQLASGFALPFGGGVRGAAGFAKAGAAEGAIYGFGSGDGNLSQRLANVPLNAIGGAVAGGTIGKAIDVGAPVVRRILGRDGVPAVADDLADIPPPPPGFEIEAPTRGAAPESVPVARADMAADDAAPALVSERIPDVIDVNAARTRPLGEGPSPDLMRAATARVEPQDVLPRPRNELTPEEAARLGEGPYQPVEAPRERDYLETSQFPSRTNPDATITRKGPADLVTFTRSLNGIRDEGGELTAAGISNAARKGEDFAGGENRLGKLVNPEGMGIEEAADRAWREGYFPEMDRPPTNQEFLAALDDTYRGVGRRFRPDDEAQIEAFEGARDQRLAVERAKQEGAPLAQDVGQPATLDDVIANTPPALDPDDWNPATLAKVGNVRVDKLDTPQEISRALKVGHDITGGFEASRRGVITQAETEALASDLGMTAADLLARRKGQAFNAEEALAARRILAASSNELVNMARRIQRLENPGDELLSEFRKAMVRHTAIQEQVSGATAEAGRALSQFRMAADSRDHQGRVLEALVNAGGGKDNLKRVADSLIELERDPANFNQFVQRVDKPGWKDKGLELYYNFLLSGPQTHAVNVLSNTLTTLAQVPEHAVASLIGKGRQALSKSDVDRVTISEVGARAAGLLQGAKEGLAEIANRFRAAPGDESGAWATAKRWGNAVADVEPSDFVTKIEGQSQHAVSGVKGKLLRLPSSALTIEDEFFKAVARRSELASQAVRKARLEGLKGDDAKARAAELLANPTDDMWEAAKDFARYTTFQRPLGEHASKIAAFTNGLPVMKAVLPFIRTPTNLIKFAVERSPAAPLLREWRQDFAAGGARRDLAMARAIIGSGVGAVIAELAAQGRITGSPPSDENKRRLLYANGWQPHSIKIGDKYYSYRRLDPFAMTFGTAADIATLGDNMSEGQKAKGAALVAASVISNLASKTWLSGLTDAIDAIKDPERYGGNWIDRLTGAVVPTGVAQIARTIDPTMRETEGTLETLRSRVPGASKGLFPKRDVWGRPIEKEGGVGPDIISPIWTTTDQKDPLTQEALRVGAKISPPLRTIAGEKMSAENYDRYQEVTGELARKWVGELIASPTYRELARDDQAEEIGKTMKDARRIARGVVLDGEPLPDARPVKAKRSRKAIPPPPPGFEVEALPPGFVLE